MYVLIPLGISIVVIGIALFLRWKFGNRTSPWDTFIAVLIPAVLTVAGWDISNYYQAIRERDIKRREVITEYLIKSYIRIEALAGRDLDYHQMRLLRFEFAFRDIMLFGTEKQMQLMTEVSESLTLHFKELNERKIKGDNRKIPPVNLNKILIELRSHLRTELGLPQVKNAYVPNNRVQLTNPSTEKYPIDNAEF